jgi:hypothetical protein
MQKAQTTPLKTSTNRTSVLRQNSDSNAKVTQESPLAKRRSTGGENYYHGDQSLRKSPTKGFENSPVRKLDKCLG